MWAHRVRLAGPLAAPEAAAAHADLPEGWAGRARLREEAATLSGTKRAVSGSEALAAGDLGSGRTPPNVQTLSAVRLRASPPGDGGARAEQKPSARRPPPGGAPTTRRGFSPTTPRARSPSPVPTLRHPRLRVPKPSTAVRSPRLPAECSAQHGPPRRLLLYVSSAHPSAPSAARSRCAALPPARVRPRAACSWRTARTRFSVAPTAWIERARQARAARSTASTQHLGRVSSSIIALLGDDSYAQPLAARGASRPFRAVIEKSRTTAAARSPAGASVAHARPRNGRQCRAAGARPPKPAQFAQSDQRDPGETSRARECGRAFARAVAADGGKHAAVAPSACASNLSPRASSRRLAGNRGRRRGAHSGESDEAGVHQRFGRGGGKPLGDGAETRQVVRGIARGRRARGGRRCEPPPRSSSTASMPSAIADGGEEGRRGWRRRRERPTLQHAAMQDRARRASRSAAAKRLVVHLRAQRGVDRSQSSPRRTSDRRRGGTARPPAPKSKKLHQSLRSQTRVGRAFRRSFVTSAEKSRRRVGAGGIRAPGGRRRGSSTHLVRAVDGDIARGAQIGVLRTRGGTGQRSVRAQRRKVLLRNSRGPRENKQSARAPRAAYRRSCRTTPRGLRYSSRSSFLSSRACVSARAVNESVDVVCRGALVSGNVPGKVQSAYPARTAPEELIGETRVICRVFP